MIEKNFRYKNADIFYRTEGQGLPVVVLHGIPFTGDVWKEQVEFLKNSCKVIVPDIPGSGRSVFEKKEPLASTIEYYAECIQALLLFENENSGLVLGHSMGGYITLAFAEKYPDMLKGFGLIHSTAWADTDERREIRRKGIELIKQKGSYEFLKNFIPPLFGKNYDNKKIALFLEQSRDFDPNSLIQYFEALMARPNRASVLDKNNLPVLFILGREDGAAPLKDVLQQVSIPQISYVHINDTGHVGMWEASDTINHQLLQFIQRFA